MRTEKEMFDLILSVASNDERIRGVYMNGSRANPNVSKDIYQDYDIVFMVTETKSFLSDKNWIAVFGEPAIIQEPNREDPETYYTWLMLFKDGNRIDLNIRTIISKDRKNLNIKAAAMISGGVFRMLQKVLREISSHMLCGCIMR